MGVTPSLAGTNPGTGTAYPPTALPTVGPYELPVPGLVPGQRRWPVLAPRIRRRCEENLAALVLSIKPTSWLPVPPKSMVRYDY